MISYFWSLLGYETESAEPSGDEILQTIATIRQQIDSQEKRKQHLELKIEEELRLASECKKNNDKPKTLIHLKKRKQMQEEVDKIESAAMNLETQILQIESTNQNLQIFQNLEKANELNKALNQGITSEKIADLQDNIAENNMVKNEMDELLLANAGIDDEAELMDELEELDRADAYANIPSVPNHQISDANEEVVVADRPVSNATFKGSSEEIS